MTARVPCSASVAACASIPCSLMLKLSLAIATILNCSCNEFLVMLGICCSSWVSMNKGTSQRDWLTPMGDPSKPSVRQSNLMVSRCSGFDPCSLSLSLLLSRCSIEPLSLSCFFLSIFLSFSLSLFLSFSLSLFLSFSLSLFLSFYLSLFSLSLLLRI